VVTAVILLAAWLLHRLVERPAARILRRLLAQPLPGPATPTDPGAGRRPDDGSPADPTAAYYWAEVVRKP
jgi:hypothetical protein